MGRWREEKQLPVAGRLKTTVGLVLLLPNQNQPQAASATGLILRPAAVVASTEKALQQWEAACHGEIVRPGVMRWFFDLLADKFVLA
jgi:hypothetical protein